jgi:hypothetical protein
MESLCISAVCVLGVVIVGLLVMTQAISLEQVAGAIGRTLLFAVLALIALCILKAFLTMALIAMLWLLKHLVVWLAVIVLVIAAVMFLARILISRLEKRLPAEGSHDNRGEL